VPDPGEYIILEDFLDIAKKLSLKFPEKYGNIPIEKIRVYAVINRDRNNSKSKIYFWNFLPEPIAQDFNVDAVCVVFLTSWASLMDKNKTLIVASALSSLEFDGISIRAKSYDVKEHRDFIDSFGIDYENSTDVPDILGLE
jgi:hypothetical protein